LQWLEVTIRTEQISVEAVANKLVELGAGGVAIQEHGDFELARREGLGDLFPEHKDMGANTAEIRGYFPVSFLGSPREEELRAFLRQLPAFGLAAGELFHCVVDEDEWENAWKDYWHPVPVGERLLIVPAWYEEVAAENRLKLLIDPGAAFGTGTHETTQLCLELLEKYLHGGETVLDLGCGSGILALAAKLLGAGRVLGVDHDELAVRASKENACLNGLTVEFLQANLFQEEIWHKLGRADIILGNLTADILLALQPHLPGVLHAKTKLILSGIISERQEEVLAAFLTAGYKEVEKVIAGRWAALCLEAGK